ncbi:MAG: ribosome-associated translation inhibitor RaiA [Clostridia bacterium]|nr:ribosome-associated translation inhibitor RaiA [Clostridia bacterium]
MKVTVIGRKTEVPKGFREIVERKLLKYEKFFKDDAEATVVISSKGNFDNLELTITSVGIFFRSEQSDETYQNALDKALNAIERQIRKNKTRLAKRLREGAFLKGNALDIPPAEDFEEETEFTVRTKSFKFKPMSCEEAIMQMNLLEHDFYVFANDESGEVNVVYRKKDGTYGCIIPE